MREAGAMVTTPPRRVLRAQQLAMAKKPGWNTGHGGVALPKAAAGQPKYLQPKGGGATKPGPMLHAKPAAGGLAKGGAAAKAKAQSSEAKPPSQGTDTGGASKKNPSPKKVPLAKAAGKGAASGLHSKGAASGGGAKAAGAAGKVMAHAPAGA